MDRDRFDAITRLLGAESSRRTALGAVIGAVALGRLQGAAARKKNRKKKKKNPPRPCFGTNDCAVPFPSNGQDFESCNLAGAFLLGCDGCDFRGADLGGADLSIVSFQGSSFRGANLRGANVRNANLAGASFRDACLVNADFEDAKTDGAHFGDAIFCNTILPNGDVDNSGCGRVTPCCPLDSNECIKDNDCPTGEICIEGVCVEQSPTCLADPDACEAGFTQCGGAGGTDTCFCYVTTEGDSRCVRINNLTNPGCSGQTCDSSADCDDGEVCSVLHSNDGICCAAQLCGPLCVEFGEAGRRRGETATPPHP